VRIGPVQGLRHDSKWIAHFNLWSTVTNDSSSIYFLTYSLASREREGVRDVEYWNEERPHHRAAIACHTLALRPVQFAYIDSFNADRGRSVLPSLW
jgi:hypothetical protein